ncbi:hypothetical protein [Dyadobacter sp. NIV53]|uniref:hypothetical protein n=1 Tax=Dyadobacter sp. NIV53 TaxID=2861765 RepID=UPI001C87BC82|nr:hypothetical protein [Dyadobacter sp. NIV53]
MACYSGFGNLTEGRLIWTGNFSGDNTRDVLFYYPDDGNWWLGKFVNNVLDWNLAGNTSGFGNLADGRPIWTGSFSGDSTTDILFYFPGDGNWWLGKLVNNVIEWNVAGNTNGFGNLWDGRPIYLGEFSGDNTTDILFYSPGDSYWWLGKFVNNVIEWNVAGNTSGFGNLADGRPVWTGNFSSDSSTDILFYFPGDSNWWLGKFVNNVLEWNHAGNTSGFGNIWDGRPVWIGDFNGDGTADVLFYFPGDGNWWLGSFADNALQWSHAGNSSGFGNIWDGRPVWTGYFSGDSTVDVLFYSPGDGYWWLGKFVNNVIEWNVAGNTNGFGNLADGRPIWTGNFSADNTTDVLFYFPGDGNWWLGKFVNNVLEWNHAGNTGRPYDQSITVHFKTLVALDATINTYIDNQFAAMETLFLDGRVGVIRGTTEDLSGDAALQPLSNLDVGGCFMGSPTTDQTTLFQNRNNAGTDDLVVYIVNSLIGGAGNFVGCASHPTGQPGCAVVNINAPWLLAHEIGHVLGLSHVDGTIPANSDFLMWPNVGWTNTPPDVTTADYTTMLGSTFTINC